MCDMPSLASNNNNNQCQWQWWLICPPMRLWNAGRWDSKDCVRVAIVTGTSHSWFFLLTSQWSSLSSSISSFTSSTSRLAHLSTCPCKFCGTQRVQGSYTHPTAHTHQSTSAPTNDLPRGIVTTTTHFPLSYHPHSILPCIKNKCRVV